MTQATLFYKNNTTSSTLDLKKCSYNDAKYACVNYHYTKTMSSNPILNLGVFENNIFKGAIIFSRGANKEMGTAYGVSRKNTCELNRIALTTHKAPVTQSLSYAINLLKSEYPEMRLIISYADSKEGHLGIIYQAGNWIYDGTSKHSKIKIEDRVYHERAVSDKYGTSSLKKLENMGVKAERIKGFVKYRYIYPLKKGLRRKLINRGKNYPKTL